MPSEHAATEEREGVSLRVSVGLGSGLGVGVGPAVSVRWTTTIGTGGVGVGVLGGSVTTTEIDGSVGVGAGLAVGMSAGVLTGAGGIGVGVVDWAGPGDAGVGEGVTVGTAVGPGAVVSAMGPVAGCREPSSHAANKGGHYQAEEPNERRPTRVMSPRRHNPPTLTDAEMNILLTWI